MKLFKIGRSSFFLFLAAFFFLLFANCGEKKSKGESENYDIGDPKKKNNIILKVEDSFYFNSDFEKYIRGTFGEDDNALTIVSLSRLFDSFIEEKILLRAAQNQKVSLTPEERREYLAKLSSEVKSDESKVSIEEMDIEVIFDRLLVEKYTYAIVMDIDVKDEEIKEYYNLHKREFLRPERIKVSQILLETEDESIEVLERIKNASEEDFRKIAKEASVGLEAFKGGEMGMFEMGQLPYEMEKVILSLKEGELSSVLESSYGYHIFRLDKRFEPELISEKDASSDIKMRILDQKIKQRISWYIEELKKNMDWSFYPLNLSFPYQTDNSR
ncbi:MAG: peptidyl-prolyl cis-trans isomerase [Candidatus Aminicenantes bacterium]|nr:peptidyl-prolyl cis-trans isomerase [Candidatus Aminicenantes bacterium]MBL7083686.1 peptidyl-prolyl cis-trans isomerase [Candidatus Aminicenantes bacterium]